MMVDCRSEEPLSPQYESSIGYMTQRVFGADFFNVQRSERRQSRCSVALSYSDVSECDNHHVGCWHLPRRQRQEDPHPKDIVDEDQIVCQIADDSYAESLTRLTQIAQAALEPHRETLLASKRAQQTDFNEQLREFFRVLVKMEDSMFEVIRTEKVLLDAV